MRQLPDQEQIELLTPMVFAHYRENFREMPSLSQNAAQVMAAAAKVSDLPLSELDALLRRDPAAAAEVLRRANAPMYRSVHDVASLTEAVVRIGRREVYHIVTALAARSLYDPKLRDAVRLLPHHWGRLQRHAVICAFGCAWLSHRLHVGDAEPMFLRGMFHDVGKLVALFALAGIILQKKIDFTISFNASAQVMEQAHIDLGCEMLIQARMPTYLVEACAGHHDDPGADQGMHLLRVVSSLNTLRENAYVPKETDAELRSSIKALDLHDAHLKEIAAQLKIFTDDTASLL